MPGNVNNADYMLQHYKPTTIYIMKYAPPVSTF